MGRDTAAAAARALRLLNSPDLRHPPNTGPTARRSANATPGAPLNLALVDYLEATADQVISHTRKVTPNPEPLPLNLDGLYDWYVRNTLGAAEADRRHRDTLIELHALEHALRLGDFDAVRPHPCPACGSWGVFWDPAGNRARCSDRDCRDDEGLASTWTPAQLIAQKIQRTEIWRRNAT
ncbi:MAG: hypothetical protein HOY79_04465 [Streptomyces sp.]|nr:hypothetical protein [Streptomyces sp.]NUS15459.1 hypothetical protein [Streptomyces sp.]NUS24083.1 hypothetical protein [Streptomyces sp.]